MLQGWLSARVQTWVAAGVVTIVAGTAGPEIAMARSHNGFRTASNYGYSTSGRSHAGTIMAGMGYQRWYSSGLQCVPFARDNSGIELTGNANTWWNAASGVYERGARPEVGSVLNFRASGRMRLGHVAVVSNVVDSRTVEIDHANWSGRGSVRRNVRVVDVSSGNDWSAVRVALGSGDYGSVYPTYGFIYDRPDRGTMVANSDVPAGRTTIALSAPSLDFRAPADRVLGSLMPMQDEEVAEASDDAPRSRRSEWRHVRSVRYSHTMPMTHWSPVSYSSARTRGAHVAHVVGKHGRRHT